MRHLHLAADSFRDLIGDPRWRWPNFAPIEMRCRATDKVKVGHVFMDKLQAIRTSYGKPILVTSGYRTPAHNMQVTGNRSNSGAHTYGRAVDILPHGGPADVPLILNLAWAQGMTRCGLLLCNTGFKFHLDDMTAEEGFAVRGDRRGLLCWTYNP